MCYKIHNSLKITGTVIRLSINTLNAICTDQLSEIRQPLFKSECVSEGVKMKKNGRSEARVLGDSFTARSAGFIALFMAPALLWDLPEGFVTQTNVELRVFNNDCSI